MMTSSVATADNPNPNNLPIDRMKKRQPEDYGWQRVFFFNLMRYSMGVLLWLTHNITIEGRENIPPHNQFIVTSNHQSNWDPVLLGMCLKQNLAFIAKQELFLANPLMFFMYDYMGCIAVDRSKVDVSTIRSAKTVAKLDHWVLGLFPEGSRITDPNDSGEGKKGAAFFARSSQCGLLPVGIRYGKSGWRKTVTAHIGKLIPYTKDLDIDDTTDTLMSTIHTLKQLD